MLQTNNDRRQRQTHTHTHTQRKNGDVRGGGGQCWCMCSPSLSYPAHLRFNQEAKAKWYYQVTSQAFTVCCINWPSIANMVSNAFELKLYHLRLILTLSHKYTETEEQIIPRRVLHAIFTPLVVSCRSIFTVLASFRALLFCL